MMRATRRSAVGVTVAAVLLVVSGLTLDGCSCSRRQPDAPLIKILSPGRGGLRHRIDAAERDGDRYRTTR